MAGILKCWREAATLILVARNSQKMSLISNTSGPKQNEMQTSFDYDVLMLKRSSKSKFMPSLYVFPGGTAHDSDFSREWLGVFCMADLNKTSELFQRGGVGPPMFNRKRDEEFEAIPSELAFRICAIRETFEESGVLLVRKSSDIGNISFTKPLSGSLCSLSESVIQPWRERVDKDAGEFVKMCKELKIVPDVWSLYEWSNWLTPIAMRSTGHKPYGRRYDTAFFVCEVDKLPTAVQDNAETVHAAWSSPDSLLRAYVRKDGGLAPPQVYELCRLLNFQDSKSLLKFAWDRSNRRVLRWFPVVCFCSDGLLYLYPGDELYPQTPDVEGTKPRTIFENTVEELNRKHPRVNRIAVKMTGSDIPKESSKNGEILCNIDMLDGQIKPMSDLSFIGLAKAKL